MTDAHLNAFASLIATGTVRAMRERDEMSHPDDGTRHGTLIVAHLTVAVQSIEKGSLPPSGRSVRFDMEQIKAKPEGWVGGPISPPNLRVGNRVKVFLARDEAGWAPVNGQGIQLVR